MTEKKTIAFPVGSAPKPIPRACSDVFRLWAALGLGILLSLLFFIAQDLYQEMGFRKQLTPAQLALEEDYGSNLIGWVGFAIAYLEGGRSAVIQKVHHCVLDGVSPAPRSTRWCTTPPETRPSVPDNWQPRPAPSTLALTAEAVRDLAMYSVDIAKTVGTVVKSPVTLTTHAVATARGGWALLARNRPAQSSSLWGPLSKQRRYTSVTVSLKDIKSVRLGARGCSVNDVALAAITGGFRARCSHAAKSRTLGRSGPWCRSTCAARARRASPTTGCR